MLIYFAVLVFWKMWCKTIGRKCEQKGFYDQIGFVCIYSGVGIKKVTKVHRK
jgi:hypothetical protein